MHFQSFLPLKSFGGFALPWDEFSNYLALHIFSHDSSLLRPPLKHTRTCSHTCTQPFKKQPNCSLRWSKIPQYFCHLAFHHALQGLTSSSPRLSLTSFPTILPQGHSSCFSDTMVTASRTLCFWFPILRYLVDLLSHLFQSLLKILPQSQGSLMWLTWPKCAAPISARARTITPVLLLYFPSQHSASPSNL